jgi:hypothetical protein
VDPLPTKAAYVGLIYCWHYFSSADRLWLGELLSQLRMMLHLEAWEEAKAVLIEYAWVEVTCSSPCKALWDDFVR